MTDIDQTELTVTSSFDDLIEGELYYSALHNSVWRLKIEESDFRIIKEGVDYRFAVVRDDVSPEYIVYSNYRTKGDYQRDSHGPTVGEVHRLKKLKRLVESGQLYHVRTDLPIFEVVDELKDHDL